MSLKEYHRLADLFSKLNSQENIEDDFTSMPDAEKLKFFWENCVAAQSLSTVPSERNDICSFR